MDLETKPTIDPVAYFGDAGIRHERGTGLDVIAAEREARAAKTARLKAAREAREASTTKPA